jgi:hypothetical protein
LEVLALESNHCCDIRRKLAEQFSVNARLYSEAVVTLTRFQSITPAEYARLREAAEKAQERAEKASAEFEEHVEWHHCGLTVHRAARAHREEKQLVLVLCPIGASAH